MQHAENKKDSSFKFSVGEDERPDSLFQAKRENGRKYDRTESRRVEPAGGKTAGWLFVLILFLIGGSLFAGYRYVKDNFSKIHSQGSAEVQNLSKDMEARLSDLSAKYQKLEESLAQKVAPLDETFSELGKTNASLKETLKKLEKSLEEIRAAKADKKELETAVKTIDPVREDVSRIGGEIKSLNEKLTGEIAKLAETVKNPQEEIGKLQAAISGISSDRVGKEEFTLSLKKHEKIYQENLGLINENLKYKEDKIKSLQDRLEKLEENLRAARSKRDYKAAETSSVRPRTATIRPQTATVRPLQTVKPDEPSRASSHPIDEINPKPGDILEQNID